MVGGFMVVGFQKKKKFIVAVVFGGFDMKFFWDSKFIALGYCGWICW